MEICVLASGSSGNATFVRSGHTSLLIDSGLSCAEIGRRLQSIGASASELDAVVLSHEHGDHSRGIQPLSYRHGTPVYANEKTSIKAFMRHSVGGIQRFNTGRSFTIGDLELTPFAVSHDAEDPVGFLVTDRSSRVGIATDMGSITLEVFDAMSGCDALVLESNHDEEMLASGPYPAWLKRRIMGPRGHLSNDDAAILVHGVFHPGLRYIVLAHLSRTNNKPELPLERVREALGEKAATVNVTLGRHDRVGELIRV